MAEEKKVSPTKASAKAARMLAPASESSDPAVHQVLAEIQTAQANNNADEVERLTQRLADLGFE